MHNSVYSSGACNTKPRKRPRLIVWAFVLVLLVFCFTTSSMATKALKPCSHPGCGVLVKDASRCVKHEMVKQGSFADPLRGSRHDRGYGNAWDKTRLRILERDGGLCQICLSKGIVNPCASKKYGAQIDHKVPKAEGGTDDDENLQTTCVSCHKEKTLAESTRGMNRNS